MKKLHIVTSTIDDGDMREGIAEKNLKKFLKSIHLRREDLVTMHQVHSSQVRHVSKSEKGTRVGKCDALVTSDSDVALGIFTADCLPIIFTDARSGITAGAHAGYKGIIGGIVQNTIRQMKALGAKEDNITMHIGPGIDDCCYDVGDDRINLFDTQFSLNGEVRRENGKKYLSLKKVVKKEAISHGIQVDNIHISPVCTKCSNRHFSFRKKNKITGLNITIARIAS